MDCPPPPPAYVLPDPDGPTVTLPEATARWLGQRDAWAEAVHACYQDRQGRYLVTLADRDALRLDLQATQAALAVEEARADEWRAIARRRPSWGLLAGVALASAAVGVYTWEIAR